MATQPTLWAATPDEVARLPRNAVHDMIERLIAWIDRQDGDPDLEEVGLEDSFMAHELANGPGCPISDPDGPNTILTINQNAQHYAGHASATHSADEDAEDDDPAEDSDSDRCLAGDDGVYSGGVLDGGAYPSPRPGHDIGSEDDAEPNGDNDVGADGS